MVEPVPLAFILDGLAVIFEMVSRMAVLDAPMGLPVIVSSQ